MNFVHNSLIN